MITRAVPTAAVELAEATPCAFLLTLLLLGIAMSVATCHQAGRVQRKGNMLVVCSIEPQPVGVV